MSTASVNPTGSMNFLITGGARGIGRGLARILLQRGHRVFLLDNNIDELAHTEQLCAKWAAVSFAGTPTTPRPTAYRTKVVDLSSRSALKDAARSASDFFEGHLDVLIHNAMPTSFSAKPMWEADDSEVERDWDMKLAVGLTAPFLLTRHCVKMLRKNEGRQTGGSIVNISSTRAHQSEPHHEAYSTAKAGLLGLTQSLSISLGLSETGIRVNAILPGWIDVGDECKEADEKQVAYRASLRPEDHAWHPAGRVGRVEDIAKTVLWLAESGFVTGQEIVVDGGVGRRMIYPED